MLSREEIYDQVGHHNIPVDLVEHIFNAQVKNVVDNFDDNLFYHTNDESNMFVDFLGEDYDDIMH